MLWCLCLQFKSARACLWGIEKLWRITFCSLRTLLAKGLGGCIFAAVLFFPALALDIVGTLLCVGLALLIGLLELMFAIFIKR